MASSPTEWTPPNIPRGSLQPPDEYRTPPPPEDEDITSKKVDDLLDQPPRVYQRRDWGAKDPRWITNLITPVSKVVLTWTETDPCFTEEECKRVVRKMQEEHMTEQGVPDIKHNFLLGRDGGLYEGRGFNRQGPKYLKAESQGHKLTGESIQIAFIEKCTSKPTPLLLKVLSECLSFGVDGNFIDKSFNLYWMSESDVMYIQPTCLEAGKPTSGIQSPTHKGPRLPPLYYDKRSN